MSQTIDKTVANLKSLILDDNCRNMNLSTVKGYYGELLVKQKLELEGAIVKHLGNQSGYDLELSLDGKIFKIDVKFSTLKDEHAWGTSYWGWALHHENKKAKRFTATHLVCVASRPDLTIDRLFVIRAVDVSKFPASVGQFKNVKHSFRILQDIEEVVKDEKWRPVFTESADLIKRGFVLQLTFRDNLLKALTSLI